jgi:hypothetical protein
VCSLKFQLYGSRSARSRHTAITWGDGHTSSSDFIETNTLAGSSGRSGLKIFVMR